MALFTGQPRTANVVAIEETEVLEIGHEAMKRVFDTNPGLVESLGHIMADRRQTLEAQPDRETDRGDERAGLLNAIKRFFGMR
jgi:CRP-like cAMP-binding protein